MLGYRKAIDRIQDVIAIVGKSKNYNQASLDLQHFINVDQKQAEAILGLKIKKLTSFEKTNLEKETKTSLALAKRLSSLLKSKNSQKKHLKKRFQKIIDTYSDSRRTTFNYGAKLVQDERAYYQSKKVVLVWDDNNNIKSLPCQNLKVQKRNGIGLNWKISKNKSHKIYTKTIFSTQNLLFFTNQGRVFLIPAFKFLEQNLMRLGISFYHYVDLHSKEQVVAVCNFDFDNNNYDSVFIFSKKGFVWCLDFNRFTKLSLKKPSLRKGFNISGDDEIISATLARKNHKVVLFSDQGRYVIYEAKKFTPRKGICLGLKGLKFKSSFDFITSAAAFDSNKYDKFLVVTKSGYGRLITINQLRVLTLRPAQGSNLVAKTEKALDIVPVSSKVKNNMISFTNGNKVICSPVALIPEVKSRSGKGVKIIKLTYGQHLIKVAVV